MAMNIFTKTKNTIMSSKVTKAGPVGVESIDDMGTAVVRLVSYTLSIPCQTHVSVAFDNFLSLSIIAAVTLCCFLMNTPIFGVALRRIASRAPDTWPGLW